MIDYQIVKKNVFRATDWEYNVKIEKFKIADSKWRFKKKNKKWKNKKKQKELVAPHAHVVSSGLYWEGE